MTSFTKNPKPQYIKEDKFLTPSIKKTSKKDIEELIEISKESKKLEDKLLQSHVKNLL